jgi:predicted transcriptional regulator
MTRKVVTVREDDDLLKAMRLMDKYDVGRLVVVDAIGTPKGILTRTDILRLIAGLERR